MATSSTGLNDAAQQIRAMDADFAKRANAGDAAALVDGFYAGDAQLLPPNAPKLSGKAGITQFWQQMISAGASDVQINTTEISASGDLAYGVGSYKFKMAGATHEGKYAVIYRRQQNGRYLAVVDMFSPNA